MSCRPARGICASVFLCLLISGPALAQTVLYVDDDASTNGDGLTWNTAYRYLQDALATAQTNGLVMEIHVAGGVYKPDRDERGNVTPGDRDATFQLQNGLAIKGGYRGLAGGGDANDRDIVAFETTLSGDLAGNDGPDFANYDENSHHVLIGTSIDDTAVLDGVTVTSGSTDLPGGGMYNNASSPTITWCTFRANWSTFRGGAMYNDISSNPTLTDCAFIGNRANRGGGMVNDDSDPTLINCMFVGNEADGFD